MRKKIMEKRKYISISGVNPKYWKLAKTCAVLKEQTLGSWLEMAIVEYARISTGLDITKLGNISKSDDDDVEQR
jgi:hypothetical protein